RLENEQALLQLRRQNLLQREALPLLHSRCGHTPSLPASPATGKQLTCCSSSCCANPAAGRAYSPLRAAFFVRQRSAPSDAPYQSRYTCPFTIDQLTDPSNATISSKTSLAPEDGIAMRSASKPGRIWPSAFSHRNARAGFTVAI